VKDVIEKLKLVMCTSIEKVVNHTRNPRNLCLIQSKFFSTHGKLLFVDWRLLSLD